MTAAASVRPPRGAKLQVYLSRTESADWHDAETRACSLQQFRKLAIQKARKFVVVFDDRGRELDMVSV